MFVSALLFVELFVFVFLSESDHVVVFAHIWCQSLSYIEDAHFVIQRAEICSCILAKINQVFNSESDRQNPYRREVCHLKVANSTARYCRGGPIPVREVDARNRVLRKWLCQ